MPNETSKAYMIDCGNLKPGDFSNPARGEIWRVMLEKRFFDLVSLSHEMEERRVPVPEGRQWVMALSKLQDEGKFIDEDNLARYAKMIREAAVERKQVRRRGAA